MARARLILGLAFLSESGLLWTVVFDVARRVL